MLIGNHKPLANIFVTEIREPICQLQQQHKPNGGMVVKAHST